MAKVSSQTLSVIFHLLQQLVALVHEAKSTDFNLFTTIGENSETIAELEELQNSAERLRASYNRLHSLTLAIYFRSATLCLSCYARFIDPVY
jgi:hypothetical protein